MFPSLPLPRLRRRFFSEAHSSLSLPEEPPAHQWHPQWDCRARCPLRGHHSPHAGPKEAGPVSDGAPGGWNTSAGCTQGRRPDGGTLFSLGTYRVNGIYLWPRAELVLPLCVCDSEKTGSGATPDRRSSSRQEEKIPGNYWLIQCGAKKGTAAASLLKDSWYYRLKKTKNYVLSCYRLVGAIFFPGTYDTWMFN